MFYIYRRHLPHWRLSLATYFVTWRLHRSQPDLPPEERDSIVDAIRRFDQQRYRLFAYVVMNDHVHVLVTPSETVRLENLVQAWKSSTAHLLKKRGRRGCIWQAEYFDRIVRSGSDLAEKSR